MTSNQAALPDFEQLTADKRQAAIGCQFGRSLANCPPCRVGCGHLLAVPKFIYPPLHLRPYVRATLPHDKDVQAWLERLNAARTGPRKNSQERRRKIA